VWGRILKLVVALAVAAAPAGAATAVAGAATKRPSHHRPSVRPHAFASCGQLVSYARRELHITKGRPEPQVTAFGVGGPPRVGPVDTAVGGTAAPTAAQGTPSGSSSPSYSTTNTQEPGVDEPDLVKTDGSTIFALEGNSVRAVDVASGTPKLVGSLSLTDAAGTGTTGNGLLLRGTKLVVIASQYQYPGPLPLAATSVYFDNSRTTLIEIDISNPAAMKVTRTMSVAGSFVDARQNGGSARFVISSSPQALAVPAAARSASGWIPTRKFHSFLTKRRYTVPVASCRRVLRPVVFSGLGMVTILTVDLDRGLYAADSVAVMADPRIVYGSQDSLYLATDKWIDPGTPTQQIPSGESTVIDRFDVTDPDQTVYGGSGVVPGFVLNQFSLSENNGYLRVASTSRPIWWDGGTNAPTVQSQSFVTVLSLGPGRALTPIGQVSGLGRGENIYSVRFVADEGYVTTFRQVDPLYTVDLSRPAAPRVTGSLEIEGYSSYLQPVGDGLLLGIGRDVGNGAEPMGSRLDLFDVSDPHAPKLAATTSLGLDSSTVASYDYHAVLFWQATGLVVLPLQVYGYGNGVVTPPSAKTSTATPVAPAGFNGAIGFHVSPSALTEVGKLEQDAVNGSPPSIDRAVVVGKRLFTVSFAGVMASSLSTFARQSFLAFPQPPSQPSPCYGGASAGAGSAAGAAPAIVCPVPVAAAR